MMKNASVNTKKPTNTPIKKKGCGCGKAKKR